MSSFAGIVGWGFALVAAGGSISSVLHEQSDGGRVPIGSGLVERRVSSGLGGIHVGSGLEEQAKTFERISQSNAGMEGLIAHGIVRDLMNMSTVFEQEFNGLRRGEGGGEMQRRPSIGGDGASQQGVGCDQCMKAVAVSHGGSLVNVELAGALAEKITDERLPRVNGPHERRDSLGIAAAG